jgi:sulfur carrier protein
MDVTVDVAGGETHVCSLPEDATYADCCSAVGLSVHEATVLVDGRPVPEDQLVAADAVTVVRLVKGG